MNKPRPKPAFVEHDENLVFYIRISKTLYYMADYRVTSYQFEDRNKAKFFDLEEIHQN